MNRQEIQDFVILTTQNFTGEVGDLKMELKELKEIVEEQNKLMVDRFNKIDTHIDNDTKWKSEYSPYLKGLAGVTVGGKILIQIILGLASIGGAILAIYHWVK
jgi:hypothetical protein